MRTDGTLKLSRPSLFKSFSRSQVASAIATAADFAFLFALVEWFHVWYVLATAIGSLIGAITNFLLNRHWSFRALHRAWHGQALSYALVSGLSLVLNSAGVYLMTEFGRVHYSISVFAVSVIIGVFVNFPLQRHYVFR